MWVSLVRRAVVAAVVAERTWVVAVSVPAAVVAALRLCWASAARVPHRASGQCRAHQSWEEHLQAEHKKTTDTVRHNHADSEPSERSEAPTSIGAARPAPPHQQLCSLLCCCPYLFVVLVAASWLMVSC